MADGPTKEELELRAEINDRIIQQGHQIRDILKEQSAESNKLNEALEEGLAQQNAFATAAEKTSFLLDQAVKEEQERLAMAKELVALEKIALDEGLMGLDAKQSRRLADLSVMKDQLSTDDSILKKLKEEAAQRKKIADVSENTRAVVQNELEARLGIKNASADLADNLNDVVEAGGDITDVIEAQAAAYKETFTKANMMKMTKNFFKGFADTAKQQMFSAGGLLEKFDELDERFTQATGATDKFGNEIKDLTVDLNEQGFTMAETERAYGDLYTQSKAFSLLTTDQRAILTEQAAQFSRLGVDAGTFAESVDVLNKTFGMSPEEVNKTTEELSNFARAMGVGPNKMLKDFNEQQSLLARYGKEKGVAMFKQLALTAKKAGLEMKDLLNVAKQFDTFEDAAIAASKLNFMLGGPLINSVDMLKASEEERIEILRKSISASGKSFKDMERFEKDLIAKTLGVDVAIAQKLFSEKNIGSIEEAQKAIQDSADGMGDLGDQADKAMTKEQQRAANQEASLAAMEDMAETMGQVHDLINEIQGGLMEWAPLMAGVSLAFQGIMGAMAIYQAIAATNIALSFGWATSLWGVVTAGWAVIAPWLAMAAPFIILGALLVGLVVYWDDVVAAISVGLDWLGNKLSAVGEFFVNLASDIMDGILSLARGIARMIIDVIFALPLGFANAIDFITGKAAQVASMIPGVSFEGTDFSGMIGGWKASVLGVIGLEEGVTNFQGGSAIVGEKGPELVTLPRGSNVITNENVNKLLGPQKTGSATSAPVEQTINIVLELDGEVLASHTAKVAMDEMTKAFSFS